MKKFDLLFRWLVIAAIGFSLGFVLTNAANASCTMTTVIDPVNGTVKTCQLCCEGGLCTTVCN